MVRVTAILLVALASAWCGGCASVGRVPVVLQNPLPVTAANYEVVWDQTVDVVDDLFTVDQEKRLRMVGDVLTVGELTTFPELGATLLEPWRDDSVGLYERTESTLQTIRRHARVFVIPSEGGYLIDVAVYKELEDLARPEYATAGLVTFRNDSSIERNVDPVGQQPMQVGWIPLGRDDELEQRILGELQYRLQGGSTVLGCPLPHVPWAKPK